MGLFDWLFGRRTTEKQINQPASLPPAEEPPAPKHQEPRLLTVEELTELLQSGERQTRYFALECVKQFPPGDPKAVPVLLKAMVGERDLFHWQFYSQALAKLGPVAVPQLLAALEESEFREAEYIGDALELMGPPVLEDLGNFLQRVQTGEPAQQATEAIYTICRNLGADADSILPVLQTALFYADATVRYWAAEAIGGIGPTAHGAIPDLLRIVEEEPDNCRGAMSALQKLGADQLVFADCFRQPAAIVSRLKTAQQQYSASESLTEAVNRGCRMMLEWHSRVAPVSADGKLYTGEDLQFLEATRSALEKLLTDSELASRVEQPHLEHFARLADVSSEGFQGDPEWVEGTEVAFTEVRRLAGRLLHE